MELSGAKKSLGQHFLVDQKVLSRIVSAASLKPGETIVEIGPGRGVLTRALLEVGAKVVAVEKDEALAAELEPTEGLTVVAGDILEVNLHEYVKPGEYRVVANIPYYLSGRLFRYFYEEAPRPRELILLLQKEVAERLTAGPGEMSLLSLSTQLNGEAELLFTVSPQAFRPAPKVESAVVRIVLASEPTQLSGEILRLARIGFAGRRKQLLGTLSAGLRLPREKVEEILTRAKVAPQSRPQELSVADWERLERELRQEER